MDKRIILLDYQATLVANFSERQQWIAKHGFRKLPYTEWIKNERMRLNLVEMIKDHPVILITARSEKYKNETVAQIRAQCSGWMPNEMYFSQIDAQPPVVKKAIMEKIVFPKFGFNTKMYFAIESNASTRSMYKKIGIESARWSDEWKILPCYGTDKTNSGQGLLF